MHVSITNSSNRQLQFCMRVKSKKECSESEFAVCLRSNRIHSLSLDLEACSMKRGSTHSQSGSRYDYHAKRNSPKHVKPFNRSDLLESLGTAP